MRQRTLFLLLFKRIEFAEIDDVLHLDLHLRLHLEGTHLVDIGDREVASPVKTLILLTDMSFYLSAIALDISKEFLDLNALLTGMMNDGVDITDRHFPTIFLTHLKRPLLIDIDLEISLQRHIADILHLQHLTQMNAVGSSRS